MPTLEAVLTTTPGASSWITAVQRIAQEIHKPNDSDIDNIKIALCSAIEYYQNHRFAFNEAYDFDWFLVEGQQSYAKGAILEGGYVGVAGILEPTEFAPGGPPADLVTPITCYALVGGDRDSGRWMEMDGTTMEDIRYMTPTTQATGYPEWYAWFGEAMHLHPIPELSNVEMIRMDYVKDIGTPTYKWNGTGWTFLHPSGATLPDSWTSRWLSDGGELIRARAKWDLYYNMYHDGENAAMQAEYVGLAMKNLRKDLTNLNHKVRRMPIIL